MLLHSRLVVLMLLVLPYLPCNLRLLRLVLTLGRKGRVRAVVTGEAEGSWLVRWVTAGGAQRYGRAAALARGCDGGKLHKRALEMRLEAGFSRKEEGGEKRENSIP